MGKLVNMTYASTLTDLCEMNSSFDKGILRIAYTGANRNKSYISKEAFERSINTIYNCPIVCNYDRETDELGGHDIELVRDSAGELQIVNATTPVGVIPESAKVWWDFVTEEDGRQNEYLYAEALLWKRQEAYKKIKADGITAQSMEITVKDGKMIDDYYHIDDFEFTAFTLIGTEPCFEGASIEVFSKKEFKDQLSEMMHDLKESFTMIDSAKADDDKLHPLNHMTEGGETVLEEKMALLATYGIDADTLDFSIDDFTVEELTEKFEAMKASEKEAEAAPAEETAGNGEEQSFELVKERIDELRRVLAGLGMIEEEWGSYPRYAYADCDFEAGEVYAWDNEDWLLYGFRFTENGDSFTIDPDSKKRKKYVIVDFDEGEQASPFISTFSNMKDKIAEGKETAEKYQQALETIQSMEAVMESLKQFKAETEAAAAKAERDNVFSKFEDLSGIEAFETLRENAAEYSAEVLEEKCYAIRGKNAVHAKFSLENKAPKIVVEKTEISHEPYGGIMAKYGITSNND